MTAILERTVILGLAVYRLAAMLAYDGGPADVFGRFRRWLGRRANDGVLWRFAADLVHCPKCSSVWLAALFSPYLFLAAPACVDAVFHVIAVMGLVYLCAEVSNYGSA